MRTQYIIVFKYIKEALGKTCNHASSENLLDENVNYNIIF